MNAPRPKRSCWVMALWIGSLGLALILLILFLAGTLFDLGVWQDFWEWVAAR